MRKNVQKEIRICDQCGLAATLDKTTFGGDPFNGWLKVEQTYDPSRHYISSKSLDFCSVECCIKYLKNDEEEEYEEEYE